MSKIQLEVGKVYRNGNNGQLRNIWAEIPEGTKAYKRGFRFRDHLGYPYRENGESMMLTIHSHDLLEEVPLEDLGDIDELTAKFREQQKKHLRYLDKKFNAGLIALAASWFSAGFIWGIVCERQTARSPSFHHPPRLLKKGSTMNAQTTNSKTANIHVTEVSLDETVVREETTTETTTEVKPGFFGRLFSAIKANPIKTTVALGAAGAAGYVAYDRGLLDFGSEEAAETTATVASAVASIFDRF